MNNEGLHPQNWRLEVKNGVKGPELGRDGMAMSIDELRSQLDTANKALNRVKADRADMDDQPILNENSQIKIEDLPVADDADKAYMDSEVVKAQEKVDRIQAKLEIAERIEKIESVIESLQSRISELKQKKEQLDALKESVVGLAGDDKDGISSGFDDMLGRIDQQIALLDSQKANLGVYLILGEANLKGEFSDEDVASVREILKTSTSLLTDEIRDKALRIAKKTKRSQIKDAQELSEFRALAKNLSGVELARLNREIVLLEKSLANAGVDANSEEQMATLLGLVDAGASDSLEADEEVNEVAKGAESSDPAQSLFREKFIESSSLLILLEEAISKLSKDSPNFSELNKVIVLLETNVGEVEKAISEIKDDEKRKSYQERWDKKGVVLKIEEAKQLISSPSEVSEIDTTENHDGEALDNSQLKPSAESNDVSEEKSEPILDRRTKLFRRVAGIFTGLVRWFGRNAGGRDEVLVVDATTSETGKTNTKKEVDSEYIFNIQKQSLLSINTKVGDVLGRKGAGLLKPDDASSFSSAMEDLYICDVEIVNKENNILSQEQRDELNAFIYVIGERLEKTLGKNYDDLIDEMYDEIGDGVEKAARRDDRLKWFADLLSENQVGNADSSNVTNEDIAVKENVSSDASAPGLEEVEI